MCRLLAALLALAPALSIRPGVAAETLVVGTVLVALLGVVPYLGALVRAVVFLLGAGVVALGGRRLYEVVSRNRGGLAEI